MTEVACVRVIWDRKAFDMPPVRYLDSAKVPRVLRFHPLHVVPEVEYPAGRKGLALAGAWRYFGIKGGADGLLILDGDVAIDPVMAEKMLNAIGREPGSVHTAPVRLWPVSTGRPDWVWAHWEKEASQEIDLNPRYFSFNFTWLPRKLIEGCLTDGLERWTFPNCDACVSAMARKMKMPVRVVTEIEPLHLHW